jgi:O-antigen/teichoic acid export membrane protein
MLAGNGIAAFFTVVDRQSDRIRITVITLAVNAMLGIALIPHWGLNGAVLTYIGTRLVSMSLSIYYLRRVTPDGLPIAPMSRLFAVGVAATTAAWLATQVIPSDWGFIVGAAVFVLIYAPASILVRFWSEEDFRLMTMITNRLGPAGRGLMGCLDRLRRMTTTAR